MAVETDDGRTADVLSPWQQRRRLLRLLRQLEGDDEQVFYFHGGVSEGEFQNVGGVAIVNPSVNVGWGLRPSTPLWQHWHPLEEKSSPVCSTGTI